MTRFAKLITFLIISFLISCSTEKNTSISRSYHNITSHYNIYFNGYQSYEKGLTRLQKNFKDNYSELLPLFYYEIPSAVNTISSDMDRAIDKASKVITVHSITAKPDIKRGIQSEKQKKFYNKKEYNKWIDDNYLLMGKAYVYKNQYDMAMEAFRKVIADFPDEPTRYDAQIWMARAYNEQKEYRESERILMALAADETLPKSLKASLYTSYADLYIKQDKPARAAEMLEKSLKYINKKHFKIRYTYILAQLYAETDNPSQAVKYYNAVIGMNPPYEMTFNAKINMARSFQAGSGNSGQINDLLTKMLKDEKNIDYHDQIYYALGEIAMKEGKTDKAINFYQKSVAASLNNYHQKGLAYLALGDLYYQIPDYSHAQAYYDSTLQNISTEYDNYDALSKKAASLSHLVQHLNVFELEDSVQVLAGLPEKERFSRIDQIIDNIRKKEEEDRLKEQEGMQDMQYSMMTSGSNRSQGMNTPEQGTKWYFYNLNAKGFGQPEFRMKWGTRKLEDNWRRNSKQTIDIAENEEQGATPENGVAGESIKVLSNKTREFYLKNIPLTDSAMTQSNLRLENALLNMGFVYREELKDDKEALKTFEEQIKRYPDGNLGLQAYYNLYELYLQAGDQTQADYYKNLIIRKFPDSPRAKILADPDYVQQLLQEERMAENSYEKAYGLYEKGDYNAVINETNYALKEYEGDRLTPRFHLLQALAIGGLRGKEALNEALDKVISEYPDHEAGSYAQKLKEHIYSMSPELEVKDTQKKAEDIYQFSTEGEFFVGIAALPADINQLNFNLVNFNLDNFNRQNLSLEQHPLKKRTIIIVRSFVNQEEANTYINTILKNEESVLRDIEPERAEFFMITPENLDTLLKDMDYLKYSLFYRKYY